MTDANNDNKKPKTAKRDLDSQYAPYVVSPQLLNRFGVETDDPEAEVPSAPRRDDVSKLLAAIEPAEVEDPAASPTARTIIDPNFDYFGGKPMALKAIRALVEEVGGEVLSQSTRQHVVALLTLKQITSLLDGDGSGANRAIYKIWPDNELDVHLHRSVRLVKAEACVRAFGAEGAGITWAVIDSGIDGSHPHFAIYDNLSLQPPAAATEAQARLIDRVEHMSFLDKDSNPLIDLYGHGTHVAGIIAGATPCDAAQAGRGDNQPKPRDPGAARLVRRRNDRGKVRLHHEALEHGLTGVAPRCKLVSLKVLSDEGKGHESAILAALDYVDQLNEDGERIRIHGVNISIGYGFDAEWYAAGHSPVCAAVNRLVKNGVVVVVSAGNDGSVMLQPEGAGALKRVGLDQSIADPGNAEHAITVGATHPESPDKYGVSYFSSRGPTADGRPKPDIVAPGERILSCASWSTVQQAAKDDFLEGTFEPVKGVAYYREESGTSMAAPHVSGACAAFLSIHERYIGDPMEVKSALMDSATDLKRKRDFQGAGMLDAFRAIQSR